MNVGLLRHLLSQWEDGMQVRLRISDTEDYGVSDGDYLEITDDRSILFENNAVVIIGDLPEE